MRVQCLETASQFLVTPSELTSDGVKNHVTASERNRLKEALRRFAEATTSGFWRHRYTCEYEPLFYNYLRPLSSLDDELYPLACEEDVRCLATLVRSFKLVEVYTEHGFTFVNSYQRPPPQVSATIEDISQPCTSATIEDKFDKMLMLTWHDSTTHVKDSVYNFVTPRQLSYDEMDMDGEACFGNVACSGTHSSGLSRDEYFRVHDLDLNENLTLDLKEDVEETSGQQVDYDVNGVDSAYETQYHVESSEDACTDDDDHDDDDFIVSKDVDVVNLDGFDSEHGNDDETTTYRRRIPTEAKDKVYPHFIESRRMLKLYKNNMIKVRAICERKLHGFIMSQGSRPTSPNQAMASGPSGSSGLTTKSKKRKNVGTNDDSQAYSSALDAHDNGDLYLCMVFKRIYVCLRSSKLRFKACNSDVLGLDGAFMKRPFLGQVLTALDLLQIMKCTYWPMHRLKMKGKIHGADPKMAAVNDVPQLVDKKGGSYVAIAPKLEPRKFNKWKKRMLCYLAGMEPYYLKFIKDGLFQPKTADGDAKPKSQWTPDERRVTDLVHSFEGPSDTKENKIMDLKLEYQTFRAKSTESLSQTYTHYKTLLSELANDGVSLSNHKINVGFVNSLLKKWLTFSQRLRNANHTQTLDLANIYGRFVYEDNLIQRRYSDTKKALITTPSMNNYSSMSKGFQPKFTPKLIQSSPNSSSQADPKFQNDYKAEYKKMKAKLALLEAKVSDDEEVTQVKVLMALADDELTVGKSHARNDEWVNITIRKLILKQAKLDAVTFQIQNVELTKLNHALQEQLKEEKKINEKCLTSPKKASQCISEQIPHQKKKVLGGELFTESSSKMNKNENLFVPAFMGYDQEMVPKTKDWVERLNPDNKLPNFNTRRILVPESQAINESLKYTKTLNTTEPSKDSESQSITPLHPLKNLQGASPSLEMVKRPIKLVNIIGDLGKDMLTRSMTTKLTASSASECLFADFLSEIEPKNGKDGSHQDIPCFCQQEEGIDYDETFVPVERMEAIRIFLDFATYMNFEVYQMDVKSAFLNGKLKEEVYVKQPPGFESSEFPDYVCKLDKALYGLKQAPRACSSMKTPMVPPNNLGPDLAGKPVNETSYRGMIGSQMYLTTTRYLKGTPTLGLCYPKCSGFDLKGYSDSDYVGCNMDRKSTSGACQILGGKMVCWSAKKQQSVAMSSVKAKYIAYARCCAKEQSIMYVPQWNNMTLDNVTFQIINVVVLYQNYLREFWSTVVSYDPFPSTDETEQSPLKEFLIKFLVLNGKRPLTLDFNTFCSSTGLDYNNGELSKKRQKPKSKKPPTETKVTPPKLTEGSEKSHSVDQTQSTRLRYQSLTKNKCKPSHEKELDTQPLVLFTYANVRAFLLSNDEAQESEEDNLGAGEEMDKDPQTASIAETHHQSSPPQANKPQSSHAPSTEASDTDSSCDDILKKYDNTLPLTERQLDDLVINKKINEATESFTKISTNIAEVISLVKGFNFADLQSSVNGLQAHALKKDKELATWAKSSTNMAWNLGFRLLGSVTPRLALTYILANVKEENDTNTSIEDPPSYTKGETDANRQEKSNEPKHSIDANIEFIGIAIFEQVEDQRKLVKDSSIIRPDPDAFIPYTINREVYYLIAEQLQVVWEEAKMLGIHLKEAITTKAGDQAFQRWSDINKFRMEALVSYLVATFMVQSPENARFSVKLKKLIAEHPDQEKLKSKKVKLEALGYEMN
uniref:Retrovirus-related Pol polyprotein from transposon TNT 1-94 n=1 Tax=Tanacetum cinerariifolium TaxID=118510 RepID=A0A6L2NKL8_TANCI|nr:retrovirus-related Pol polyprotein from transposon TNT 1-94 [Tanacetum cinerariifolium]